MTTHVLIVDKDTFKKHLEYMFVGTGTEKSFQFNNDKQTYSVNVHPSTEKNIAGLIADCNRMREGDNVIFYLQQSGDIGGFFGIFKVKKFPSGNFVSFTDYKSDTYPSLTKEIQYRALIEPYKVYSEGVSEWEALDDIRGISCPCQMLWSLIYRKLKGNRGNTMITLYEADRLINLIVAKNKGKKLNSVVGGYSYDETSNKIVPHAPLVYDFSQCEQLDISKRLIYKYRIDQKHETHLQSFITNNIGKGTCASLDSAIMNNNDEVINWIGNEVSCGVGMQRMDIVFSTKSPEEELNNLYVIELKCVPIEAAHIQQMNRYIDWLTQYYIPNLPSKIIPVLITRGTNGNGVSSQILSEKNNFDNQYIGHINYCPLKIINYRVINNNLFFNVI